MNRRSRAFTLIEAILIAIFIVLLVAILLPAGGACTRGPNPRFVRDQAQLRGVLQSMIRGAGNNKDQYPLPSQLDVDGATVAGDAAARDTTANICSILIWNGLLPAELFVGPAEVGNIARDDDYQTASPPAAVDPARALWDPAFRADFTGRRPGNTSYAHMAPVDDAGQPWMMSFAAQRAILANRGPQVTSVTDSEAGPTPTLAKPGSNTLRIHGSRMTWEGNVAYDDNHVEFETSMAPEDILYTTAAGARQRDTLFFDEPDDPAGDNNFLAITIPAPGAAGGRTIWD